MAGVDLVAVGLQEVEMGTSSVARAAVVEALQRGNRGADAASQTGRWWADEALRCLQVRFTRGLHELRIPLLLRWHYRKHRHGCDVSFWSR